MNESSMNPDYIVVGGGTNGLSAAAYLGKEGQSVLVIESSALLGGAALTRELTLPGFKHDVFATSLNIWRASSIQQDLELEKYGLQVVDPDPVASTPFKDGSAITIHKDINNTLRSISTFSEKDASRFKQIYDFYLESKDILLGGMSSPPLSFSSMMSTLEESDTGLDFLQFSYLSARDWLEENFESEEMKAFMTIWGSNHLALSPEDAGSALIVLLFIGILQDAGAGVPIGGMSSLVGSMRKYIESHGGIIMTGDAVSEVLVKDGHAEGVKTNSGRLFHARKGILSSVEPKTLFLRLVPESAVSEDFRKKVKAFRYSKVSEVMIHAALDDWLDYRSEEVRKSGIVQVGDSLDQVSRAYNDCVVGRAPDNPFMTIDNTSCYDATRAPGGKHILWHFVRAPSFLGGKRWSEEQKENFADRCIARLSDHAPNIKRIILKRVVLSPQDIERLDPNLVNADAGLGKGTMDQSLALRPFPGWSQYRTPIRGLYMCGSATHPGGGVSGLPGHNSAYVAMRDAESG